MRLRVIAKADRPTFRSFVRESVARGSVVRTDGWPGYDLARLGYEHRSVSDREAGGPGRVLPLIHREFSNLKTWLGGTHQGRVQRNHLQAYLNEFAFRHNRRFWRFSAFQRLLQLPLVTQAPSYRDIYRALSRHASSRRRPHVTEKRRLYPGFATDNGSLSDPKRCRYRTGAVECKCAEFRRFLHKRVGVMDSVASQVPDCVWAVHGLRRNRRPCAPSMDSCNEPETPCSVEGRLSILRAH